MIMSRQKSCVTCACPVLNTVDGSNPASTWDVKNLVNDGRFSIPTENDRINWINDQPQLVSSPDVWLPSTVGPTNSPAANHHHHGFWAWIE